MIKAITVDKPELIEAEIEQAKKEFMELPVTITLSPKVEKFSGSDLRHNDFIINNLNKEENG